MTTEQLFVLVIVLAVLILILLSAVLQARTYLVRLKHMILDRFNIGRRKKLHLDNQSEKPIAEGNLEEMTEEESMAELERLQQLIEVRKKIAWETDISHHLWDLYVNHFRNTSSVSHLSGIQSGEWYDLNIRQASTQNGLNTTEFELKGSRYKFVDNEETKGTSDNLKLFSLFLYDESDRCLIEIPMRMRIDSEGQTYSISSGGPKAFLLGDWINEFIHVKLKHQSLRNQKIREQEHQERLAEIEDLRGRFGEIE